MVEHVSITDPFIHEPKGASTASAEQVYVADGLGSGAWRSQAGAVLCSHIADISTASSIYIPVVQTGTVEFVAVTIHGAISTTDDVITVYNTSGVSMGTITVPFTSSAAGDTFTLSPVSDNTVIAGGSIRVQTNGASAAAVRAEVAILVRPI
jgi:hypothetical protein